MKYFLSFKPKHTIHIKDPKTILKINNVNVVKEINKAKILEEPIKEDIKIRIIDAFLFKVLFTVKRRRKSKNKLSKKTRSKYMVISSPNK